MQSPESARTAIVGGSTSGLGLASARALAAAGHRVVLVGRRGEQAAALAARLPTAIGVGADLTTPEGMAAVVAATRDAFGEPEILVVNGGGPPRGTAAELDVPAAVAAIEALLLPAIRLVRTFLPGMRERGWGRLIAIGSSGMQQPIPELATSNVGRAALAAYLKTLAAEVAADGVTVNVVIPGRIETDRARELDERTAGRLGIPFDEARRQSVATIPAGRLGTADEFAAAVAFLASAAASYITGSQLRVDGGLIRGL